MAAFGPDVIPLDGMEALTAFRRVLDCSSSSRYGLNEAKFTNIERLDVEEAGPEVTQWLAERVGDGELLLAFAKDAVFRVPASLFLDRWQDMFGPSRDDVVILPTGAGWALFYCHEDEFEFARGGLADNQEPPLQG
jgi:hypothetical protein